MECLLPPTCTARAAFVRGKGNRRTPKETRAKGMRPARTSLLAFSSSLRAAARMRTSFAVSSGPSPISSRMAKPCPAGVSRFRLRVVLPWEPLKTPNNTVRDKMIVIKSGEQDRDHLSKNMPPSAVVYSCVYRVRACNMCIIVFLQIMVTFSKLY